MSLPLEAPCSPHLTYMGLVAMGGQGMGFNSSGRITKFYPEWSESNLKLRVGLEPVAEDHGIRLYQNKEMVSYPVTIGDDYVYDLVKSNSISKICVTPIPLNSSPAWNAYPGPLSESIDNRIDLTWSVDVTTDKVSVYHYFNSDSDNYRCVQINSGNNEIDVIRESGDAEVSITGTDGDEAPGGAYKVYISNIGDATSVDILDMRLAVQRKYDYDGLPISVSTGLVMNISSVGTGASVFDVRTHVKDDYSLNNPVSATHNFMVRAHRFEDDEVADSEWVSVDISRQIDPVTNVSITYEYAGAVRITFKMPDTLGISGYRVYMTRSWQNMVEWYWPYDIESSSESERVSVNNTPFWFPMDEGAATGGQTVSTIIGNLDEGTYYFYVRAIDDFGNDCESANMFRFTLQGSGIESGSIKPPISIKGWSPEHNKITLEVITLMNEEFINVYSDNKTGTIDWEIPINTLYGTGESSIRERMQGTKYGKYEFTMEGFNDGVYLLGVRCFSGTVHDGGTNNYVAVKVFSNALMAPYSVYAREVIE